MRKVTANINIQTSPEKIISAFTEQELLKGWWQVERSLVEKKRGGVYILTWQIKENGFGYVSSGVVETYQADAKLVIDKMVYLNPEKPILGPMRLIVEVKIKNGFSEVTVHQEGYQNGPDWDWYYEAVKEAWPMALENLKKYLEKDVWSST